MERNEPTIIMCKEEMFLTGDSGINSLLLLDEEGENGKSYMGVILFFIQTLLLSQLIQKL